MGVCVRFLGGVKAYCVCFKFEDFNGICVHLKNTTGILSVLEILTEVFCFLKHGVAFRLIKKYRNFVVYAEQTSCSPVCMSWTHF